MTHPTRTRRVPATIFTLTGLFLLIGCGKLVGIEDTTVTRGNGGSDNGGASTGGSSSLGGSAARGGTGTSGNGTGGNGTGGAAAGNTSVGGGSAGKGGGATTGGTGAIAEAGAGGETVTSDCPCAAPTPTCENGKCVVRGPVMVQAAGFYIDSTEVTAAQYAVFQKAKGTDTSGQPAECAWNTTYDPQSPSLQPNAPIAYVDFCDAAAYCAWADERLCGNIAGGPIAPADIDDVTKSQWYEACGGPAEQEYPYGNNYNAGNCNDGLADPNALVDVASFTMCQGSYPGLYDMAGNALEWVDSCTAKTGATDNCGVVGGSYVNPDASCYDASVDEARNSQAPALGFRCCSK